MTFNLTLNPTNSSINENDSLALTGVIRDYELYLLIIFSWRLVMQKHIMNIKAKWMMSFSVHRLGCILRLVVAGFAMLLQVSPVSATTAYLLVDNRQGRDILRYDAETGAFIDVLVKAESGGMNVPYGMTIGLDGDLYVASTLTETYPSPDDPRVLKFDSYTGEYLGTFASDPQMILSNSVAFGPDGDLYVAGYDGSVPRVFRFDGETGASMGIFATGHSGDSYCLIAKIKYFIF